MKKVFLIAVAVGLFFTTSCSKEEPNDNTVNETTATDNNTNGDPVDLNSAASNINNELSDFEIPNFSNEDVQVFANDYANYFKLLFNAHKSNNTEELQELMKQGVDWNKKASVFTQQMSDEDKEKWVAWTIKLQDMVSE